MISLQLTRWLIGEPEAHYAKIRSKKREALYVRRKSRSANSRLMNNVFSGFATFADFFFDGFFVDWFVQSKINNSLDSVNGAISRINHVLRDLINNQNALKDQLSERKAEVKRILES